VARTLSPWGLFRLLKALEAKEASGGLELHVEAGTVRLTLVAGRPVAVDSASPAFSFREFLRTAHVASDAGLARLDAAAAASGSSIRRVLASSSSANPDSLAKLDAAHVRKSLAALLPAAATDWAFGPAAAGSEPQPAPQVDLAAELMRTVAGHPDVSSMRSMAGRMRASGTLGLATGSEALLSHARAQFGDARVLFLLRQGRSSEIDERLLEDDVNARTLFALSVAGGLVKQGGAGSSGFAPSGVSTVSEGPVIKELKAAFSDMNVFNHYEALGVPTDARVSAVEGGYTRAMRRFARVRFEGVAGSDALPLIDAIHAKLADARATLTDRGLRLSYNRTIGVATPGLEARVAQIFEARAVWATGMDMMDARRPGEAAAQFEEASRQDPEEPLYAVATAKALLAQSPTPETTARARAILEEAVRTDEEMVDAHVGLAQVCRLEGARDEATVHVRAALRLDPENVEARAVKGLLQAVSKPSKIAFQKRQESVVEKLVNLIRKGSRPADRGGGA